MAVDAHSEDEIKRATEVCEARGGRGGEERSRKEEEQAEEDGGRGGEREDACRKSP